MPGTDGLPGSYADLDTPSVIVEQALLERNIAEMADAARDRAVVDAGSKTLTSDRGAHGRESLGGHGTIVGRSPPPDAFDEMLENGRRAAVSLGLPSLARL